MSDRIVLSGPNDVVAAVPSLLGFIPRQSLVALWTTANGTLVCTVRLDLSTPSGEMSRRLFDVAASIDTARLVLVAYPDSLAEWIDSADEDRILELSEQLRAADIDVVDALVVTEGRYFSMICTDEACCPVGGRPAPDGTTTIEAELVAAGHPAVASDRVEVVARYALRPDLTPSRQELEDAAASMSDRLADACPRALTSLQRLADSRRPLGTSGTRAELMWALQDVTVRDYVIAHLAVEEPDRRCIEALVQVALCAPEDLRPRLAGAAAAVLYASAESSVAVWTMIEHAEDDSLASLVASALDICTPPTVLRDCFRAAMALIDERIRDQDVVA